MTAGFSIHCNTQILCCDAAIVINECMNPGHHCSRSAIFETFQWYQIYHSWNT